MNKAIRWCHTQGRGGENKEMENRMKEEGGGRERGGCAQTKESVLIRVRDGLRGCLSLWQPKTNGASGGRLCGRAERLERAKQQE